MRTLLIVALFLAGAVQAHDLSPCQSACASYAHTVYNACIAAGNTPQYCYTVFERTYHECVKANCH